MSIQNTRRVCGPYACNGQITQFPFDFKVFEAGQVAVQVGDALDRASPLTFGADYSVALNDDQDAHPGGTVTLHTAYAKEYRVGIISNVPNTQPDTLINLGGFYPKVIERALDRLEAQIQQVDSIAQRSVRVPIFSATRPDGLLQELKADAREAKLAREEAHGWADSALGHSREAAASQQTASNAAERAADALSAAEMFANNASNSERSAISYAARASVFADAAKVSETAAALSAADAKNSEIASRSLSNWTKNSATSIKNSATSIKNSEIAVNAAADSAKASETAAASSATAAKASEVAAAKFASETWASRQAAASSASTAFSSNMAAGESADNASASASNAKTSQGEAKASENAAITHAQAALSSQVMAASARDAAQASAKQATASAAQAKASETAAMRANEAIAEANAKVEAKFAALDSGLTAVGNGLTGAWQNVGMAMGPQQTMQILDIVSGRLPDVNYANSTGRPIFIYVRGNATGAGTTAMLDILINGLYAVRAPASQGNVVTPLLCASALIPPGSTYIIRASNLTIDKWREYR